MQYEKKCYSDKRSKAYLSRLIYSMEQQQTGENRKSGRLKSKNGYALLCVSLVLIDRKQLENFFLCIKNMILACVKNFA